MSRDVHKNPEQIARDRVDDRLRAAGWDVQDRNAIDFNASERATVLRYVDSILRERRTWSTFSRAIAKHLSVLAVTDGDAVGLFFGMVIFRSDAGPGLTLWECELADVDAVAQRLSTFLDETVRP